MVVDSVSAARRNKSRARRRSAMGVDLSARRERTGPSTDLSPNKAESCSSAPRTFSLAAGEKRLTTCGHDAGIFKPASFSSAKAKMRKR